MSVNRFWMPIIAIATLLGAVFGSQLFGWWAISGRTSVDLDQFSPADIKGWMTLQQVADGLQLSVEEVYRVGAIPADIAPDTALKDMEEIIEVSTLRDVLAEYLAGGATAGQTVEPPAEVATTPQSNLIPATSVPQAPESTEHTGDGTGPTPLPPGQILPANQIKGRMTLREVSEECAVEFDALLAALNLPPDSDPDTQLKTLIEEGTLDEVTQVQGAVAALQE